MEACIHLQSDHQVVCMHRSSMHIKSTQRVYLATGVKRGAVIGGTLSSSGCSWNSSPDRLSPHHYRQVGADWSGWASIWGSLLACEKERTGGSFSGGGLASFSRPLPSRALSSCRPLQRCIRRHATSRLFVPSRNGHPFLICRYFQPPFGLLFWTSAFGICPHSQAPIEYRATFAKSDAAPARPTTTTSRSSTTPRELPSPFVATRRPSCHPWPFNFVQACYLGGNGRLGWDSLRQLSWTTGLS